MEDIESFAKFVMEQWQRLPRAPVTNSARSSTSIQSSNVKSKAVNVHVASGDKERKSCFNCGVGHALASCFKFRDLSVGERWDVVKKNKVCFSCLSSQDHRANECTNRKKCGEASCEKLHHWLLHKNPEQGRDEERSNSRRSRSSLNGTAGGFTPQPSRNVEENGQAMNQHSVKLDHQVHGDEGSSVTAKVVAVRILGANGRYVDDFAFLDDGSSLTMMD